MITCNITAPRCRVATERDRSLSVNLNYNQKLTTSQVGGYRRARRGWIDLCGRITRRPFRRIAAYRRGWNEVGKNSESPRNGPENICTTFFRRQAFVSPVSVTGGSVFATQHYSRSITACRPVRHYKPHYAGIFSDNEAHAKWTASPFSRRQTIRLTYWLLIGIRTPVVAIVDFSKNRGDVCHASADIKASEIMIDPFFLLTVSSILAERSEEG